MKLLFLPDPAEGGDTNPVNQNPAQPPATPPASQSGQAPPAAGTVLNGDRSERELKLEEDLKKANERAEKAEGTVKERETQISHLEDRLNTATTSPASAGEEIKPFRFRRIKL